MTEDSDFVNVPRRVLLMTDPLGFWDQVILESARRGISYNKAFQLCNSMYYDVFKRDRFSDIDSARGAMRRAKKHNAAKQTDKLLGVFQKKRPTFVRNITRLLNMDFYDDDIELQPGISWADDLPGGVMTAEKAAELGLSPLWEEYEKQRKLPPIVLTRENFERLCDQVPTVKPLKI